MLNDSPRSLSKAPRTCLRSIDPQLASVMFRVARGQTDEILSEQFGLSYNSWRKIKAGLPIRCSLADRVEHRIRAMVQSIEG